MAFYHKQNKKYNITLIITINKLHFLTILSIPRGPKLVRIASETAVNKITLNFQRLSNFHKFKDYLTSCGNKYCPLNKCFDVCTLVYL